MAGLLEATCLHDRDRNISELISSQWQPFADKWCKEGVPGPLAELTLRHVYWSVFPEFSCRIRLQSSIWKLANLCRLYWLPYLVAQMVKNLPIIRETWIWSLGREDLLEKGMATYSSILAWRNPWTEEPGWLECMVLQRVGDTWASNTSTFIHCWPIMLILIRNTLVKYDRMMISSIHFLFLGLCFPTHG